MAELDADTERLDHLVAENAELHTELAMAEMRIEDLEYTVKVQRNRIIGLLRGEPDAKEA